MANIGDKFIITIGDRAENEQSGETLYRIKGFKSLVFDENGIEKLEKYEGHNVEAPTIEPKRKFIRIITRYLPDDIVCYEEYKGKPYFSIEYQENEETIVGFGTYNPDVLSSYLRDYFSMRGEENG